jgi:hypothetical protein
MRLNVADRSVDGQILLISDEQRSDEEFKNWASDLSVTVGRN